MRRSKRYTLFLFLPLFMAMGFNSDDEGESQPTPTVTSFSGRVLYKATMEPVTNAELFISGTDTEPLRSPKTRAGAILKIEDGTFEKSFETIEEVDRFGMAIDIFQGNFIINSFGQADGLECLPGNCDSFPPGQDYELTILIPCDPDDCVLFPPPN